MKSIVAEGVEVKVLQDSSSAASKDFEDLTKSYIIMNSVKLIMTTPYSLPNRRTASKARFTSPSDRFLDYRTIPPETLNQVLMTFPS